jgi:CheY-like chemotaxis protein
MSARVLVVDDSPINLWLTCYVLESAGYVVENAVDAEQAQELLKQVTPDLILTDISLPGMDGLTFTRKLKADERLKNVPVVALTASDLRRDRENAFQAGCVGYITKPIDTRQLAQQVALFLQGDKAASQ